MKTIQLTYHKNTDGKENKLNGIVSINTSSLCNDFCNKIGGRQDPRRKRKGDVICHYCYAEKNEVAFGNLEKMLQRNSEILKEKLEVIPFINASFVRFHSFGELINEAHMENFYRIAKENKNTTFCLMTKRYDLAMKYKKLKNVIYIASSPFINKKITDPKILEYFDKTFTVYEKDFDVEKNNVKINCHGKSCVQCKLCYSRKGSKEIAELLRK